MNHEEDSWADNKSHSTSRWDWNVDDLCQMDP